MHKQIGFANIILTLLFIQISVRVHAYSQNKSYEKLIEKALSFKNRNSDSLNYFATQAYTIAKKNANADQKIDALLLLAKSNIKSGDLVSALGYCDTARLTLIKHPQIKREGEVLIYLGNTYQAMGLTEESLKYFFEALKILDRQNLDSEGSVLCYYIALSYYNIGDTKNGLAYLKLSIRNAIKQNHEKDLFSPYLLLSNSFSSLDSIRKYVSLSRQIIEKFPELIFEKVVLLNNQALINKSIGNLTLSKAQYNEAINISRQSGFRYYLSNLYNNYAYQLMAEQDYDSANIVLNLALTLAKELRDTDVQASIYDSYSDYFSAIKRFETSLAYKDSSIVTRREYHDQQRIQESLFLSAVFETEKKEKELLKRENQISRLWVFAISVLAFFVAAIGLGVYLKQKLSLSKSKLESVERAKALGIAEALIQGQDAERKRLAMDLHDGPVANIGVLRFMVDGFFQKHAKYNEVIESIKSINRQVREISHRMLPAHIQEQGLILTIQNMIDAINNSGKFTVEFDSNILNRLSDKLELNIYYLIYELINNATKHSNGDSIFVQLFELEKSINLSVEDNGQGFDPTIVNDGIGLRNIKTRIDYLGGKLEIISDEQTTLFIIEIPTFYN
ncbi:MAG: hypothetical protein K9G61_02410 [Bacteroidales bacterium]|nr:hypothetical protein [Bacteroidales bacterium]